MNYIGSKYSLMDFLTTTIADVAGTNTKGKVFADLFAGTGVVGKTFKEQGYRVISNDIQYYSYVLNKHLIENVPPLVLTNSQEQKALSTKIIAQAPVVAGSTSPIKTE